MALGNSVEIIKGIKVNELLAKKGHVLMDGENLWYGYVRGLGL